jgi:hypothetical protein
MKLLGITDLAKRWNYTRQGVHLKMQLCESFPRPIATINKNILVFDEEEIAAFEQTRKELTDAKYKHWYTHKRWLYKEEEIPPSFLHPTKPYKIQ